MDRCPRDQGTCKDANMVTQNRNHSNKMRRFALLAAILSCPACAVDVDGQELVAPAGSKVPAPKRIRRLPPVPSQQPPDFLNEPVPAVSPTLGMPKAPSTPSVDEQFAQWEAAVMGEVLETATPTRSVSPRPWLRSITTDSCSSRALARLDEASREYSVGAWASAEASGWEALEQIARGIDIADRQTAASSAIRPTAALDLGQARVALREARDFIALSGSMDQSRIETIVASHQTPVFREGVPNGISDTVAADRYLDFARQKLTGLARASVHAARAMDLIAAVRLGRDQANQLPMETALCLRRAAFSGQPANGSLASRLGMQLADMGLDTEAKRTLSHASTIEPSREVSIALANVMARSGHREEATQLIAGIRQNMSPVPSAKRVPQVLELTPEQFAAISPAHNLGHGRPAVSPGYASAATNDGVAAPASSRKRISAEPVGFTQSSNRSEPAANASGEYADEAYREDRDPSYYKATRPPSTMQRIFGRLPKFPKFRAW